MTPVRKVILGHKFPAGKGQEEGEAVLDCSRAIRRRQSSSRPSWRAGFVSDTPAAALVARAAKKFEDTDGDIREVVRTIVTSQEFLRVGGVSRQGEVTVRTRDEHTACDECSARCNAAHDAAREPSGPADLRTSGAERLSGNGDAWMNTGAILNRINFGLAAAGGRGAGREMATGRRRQRFAAGARAASGRRDQGIAWWRGVQRHAPGALTGTNPFLQARAAADTTAVDDETTANSMNGATVGATWRQPSSESRSAAAIEQQQKVAGREAVKPGQAQH
jgi:hypothetical protein